MNKLVLAAVLSIIGMPFQSYSSDVSRSSTSDQPSSVPDTNGHEYVDLGLPSGVKWATCNVGAERPEHSGSYFAWGEIWSTDDACWAHYKWCKGQGVMSISFSKYCSSIFDSEGDDKTTLDLEDDAAHMHWGGSWRMPTETEIEELIKTCKWKWTKQNGVKGYKIKGPNGNFIFLPVSGYRGASGLQDWEYKGYYWSSSLLVSGSTNACFLFFMPDIKDKGVAERYNALPIRPVCQ